MSAAKNAATVAMQQFVDRLIDSLKPAYSEIITLAAGADTTIQLSTIIDNLAEKDGLDIQITVSQMNDTSGDPFENYYVVNPSDIQVGKNATSVRIVNNGSSSATIHVVISQIFK